MTRDEIIAELQRLGAKRSEMMNVGPVRVALMSEAAALLAADAGQIKSGEKLAAQVQAFHQWLDDAADQLDEGILGKAKASEGSMALTAASVKLAEMIAGPDESDDPKPEQYLADIRAFRVIYRTQLAALRRERDSIVKELDETREKHLREARAADEARDDFESLRSQIAADAKAIEK